MDLAFCGLWRGQGRSAGNGEQAECDGAPFVWRAGSWAEARLSAHSYMDLHLPVPAELCRWAQIWHGSVGAAFVGLHRVAALLRREDYWMWKSSVRVVLES